MDLLLNPEWAAMPAGFLRSRSRLTGTSGADSQRKQLLFLVDLKKMLPFYIKK
jgi:hypothetical protein